MATTLKPTEDPLAAGHEALGQGQWEEARGRFRAALDAEESAAAWEGLGWAAWWLGDAEGTFAGREGAFRAHRSARDARGAGRMAVWMANDSLDFRGDPAAGAGWLERARHLLEGQPPGSEHGWLLIIEGRYALQVEGDPEESARRSRAAIELGRELAIPDLEALGLALEGEALVVSGRVEEGTRRLDEAAAVTAAEEFAMPVSPVFALCALISACERVGDFPRAAASCAAIRALGERWHSRHTLGVCRSAYGHVLACRGDWTGAESELMTAVGDLRSTRPGLAPWGLVRLGELRLRQGRAVEARELFEQASPYGPALVGLGTLALEDGDARGAADAAERILRRLGDAALLDRVAPLELLARARAHLGETEEAERAAEALREVVAGLRTPYLRGRDRLVAAELAAARGDDEEARRAAEDAVDLFEETAAPYEAALARLVLARALFSLERDEAGASEAKAAGRAFSLLGAARDVRRAAAIESGTRPSGENDRPGIGELTARECEVLRLVAQGLSDAEIADRLVLSPHTVHRHVANVRVKLRLPSRAAAVAYAARAGLL